MAEFAVPNQQAKTPGVRIRAPRMGRWEIGIFTAAAIFAGALAILPHLTGLGGGTIPIAQSLIPVIAVAAFLLVIATLLLKQWLAAGVLALGAISSLIPMLLPSVPMAITGVGGQPQQIAVLSLNTFLGRANTDAVSQVLQETDPDIVVLLEVSEFFIERLATTGSISDLQYRTAAIPSFAYTELCPMSGACPNGSVILSRWPLSTLGEIPGSIHQQPTAIVNVPNAGPIQIAAIHPYPPLRGATAWRAGLQAIAEWQLAHTSYPLIMAGDFNASTAHPVFRLATSNMINTASAAGIFPRPTWPSNFWLPVPTFTQIDHILVRDMTPLTWHRVRIARSDHYGITAIIEWNPSPF